MSQYVWKPVPGSWDGPQLRDAMDQQEDAQNTLHRGAARPSYAQAGMAWIKEVSGTLWELNVFDGTTDVVIANINPSTHAFALPNKSVLLATLADISTARLLGRATAAAGVPESLTAAQVRTLLNVEDGATADQTDEEIQDIVGGMVSGNTETDITVTYNDATGKLDFVVNVANPLSNELLYVRDQKPSGTDGGTFTSGAWRTRDLNSVKLNQISGASVASNQITLPAGDYLAIASAPAFETVQHQTRLRNITANTTITEGTSEQSNSIYPTTTRSWIFSRFTLAAERDLEIQHRCNTTSSTDGFGSASSFGEVEVYTTVFVWKVG